MKKILFFLLAILLGCKSIETTTNNTNVSGIEIVYKGSNEFVEFTLKNLSDKEIKLVKRNTLDIEMLEGESWRKIKILPCPCDAPCREINNEIVINPNDDYEVSWNMLESWCGKRKENEFVRETIYQKVEKGKYRIQFVLKKDKEILTVEKEFNIN